VEQTQGYGKGTRSTSQGGEKKQKTGGGEHGAAEMSHGRNVLGREKGDTRTNVEASVLGGSVHSRRMKLYCGGVLE